MIQQVNEIIDFNGMKITIKSIEKNLRLIFK